MNFNNLSIRVKIAVMVLIPVLGVIYFSATGVMDKKRVSGEMESVRSLAGLAVRVSALVHETQKERGATAGYLGSKGTKFVTELPAQRKNTDQRRAELEQFLAGFDAAAFGSAFQAQLGDALNRLGGVEAKRQGVTAQSIPAKEAIGYYTAMNGAFLDLIGRMTELTSNGEVGRMVAAYVNFLLGKERAGIERAVLANTFAADKFGPGLFRRFGALVTEQDTYARVFQSLATDEAKRFYEQTMRGEAVDEVEKMRDVAFDKAAEGGFGVDSVHWFKTQTAKINLLKKVEDNLSEALVKRVDELHGSATAAEILYLIISLVVVVLAVAAGLLISRNIVGSLHRTLAALEDIAEGEGDLTQRLAVDGRDEIAQVSDAFNRFVAKMQGILVEIREAADSIATSSDEIARGNLDLSQRTEEQASSLEETASSMEEMTSTVKQNADNARQANQLAAAARDKAGEGGEVVREAVSAMGGISGSSKKIADIIGVIDEIAFQTNLLALNAAVEAARAGEQGRGFAVVAGEVRKLAQRSADSAKQIKELINESVERVDEGSRLVERSGQMLDGIIGEVKKVTDIISEIAAASSEQSAGIDQVNKAVMQMDEMTQQNAALVEEAAAASKSMDEQAQALLQQIGFFKLS